mgnify:CR=1 FL=1
MNNDIFPISDSGIIKKAFLHGIIFFFFLLIPITIISYGENADKSLYVILLIVAIFIPSISTITLLSQQRTKKMYFRFDFLPDRAVFEQAIMEDYLRGTSTQLTPSPALRLAKVISIYINLFSKRKSVPMKIEKFEIHYSEVKSISLERGSFDKLCGLSKLIIKLKNILYSDFDPPLSSFFGADYFGDTTIYRHGRIAKQDYKRIIIIPYLKEEQAAKLFDLVKNKIQVV